MKNHFLSCLFFLSALCLQAQRVNIYKLYSENQQYYLQSIPYTDSYSSVLGKAYVYRSGQQEPLYSVNRHFPITRTSNLLQLSNDGQTIMYINSTAKGKTGDTHPLTVYRQGLLVKAYTLTDFIECDPDTADCELLYHNTQALCRDSGKWENGLFTPGFYPQITAAERFANTYNVFSKNDTLYLTDYGRQLNIFSLQTGERLRRVPFDAYYSVLIPRARYTKYQSEQVKTPSKYDLPPLRNGQEFAQAISELIGMPYLGDYDQKDEQYKKHFLELEVLVDRSGQLQILKLEADSALPAEKVKAFLLAREYDMSSLAPQLESWRFESRMPFRNPSKTIARREKKMQQVAQHEAYIKRLTMDTIDGFYIPRDLGECMQELDRLLATKDREMMKAKTTRNDMIAYHHGLGTFLRNNWGLWGGSRLQQYFFARGLNHPDNMSALVLEYYHDWLNGQTGTWKDWEAANLPKNK